MFSVFESMSNICCIKLHKIAEVGTNNFIPKAQRNKAQRSFQPVKAQRKMRNLIFLISEAQCSFRNDLFDQLKRNAVPQSWNCIFVPS